MEEQTDQTVMKNMSIVLGILVVFAICIFFIARSVGFKEDQGNSPGATAAIEERIKPVAGAYTGDEGPPAVAEAASAPVEVAPAETAPAQAASSGGTIDAEKIYKTVCFACHDTGVAAAPKPGSEAMAQRAEKGLDALVQTALSGLNAMPPRGGRADLTDEQVKAVVEFMLQ